MKKILLLGLTLLIYSSYLHAQGEWSTLKTGAGGWITGMDINPDGTKFIRSDVGGAYRLDNASDTWIQLVTNESMPVEDIHWSKYGGVLSVASAPSDVNRTYMAYYNTIYISNNQGTNWQRTNFPSMEMRANDEDSKLHGERLEVDPNNKDVVYFGSIENGIYSTANGLDWNLLPNIPSGTAGRGIRSIKFDSNSTVENGVTQVLYVAVDGVGIYQSTNGGNSFTLITTGLFPTNDPWFYDMEIDDNGTLYFSGRDGNTSLGLYRYNLGTWTQVFSEDLSNSYSEIAIDPVNNDRVLLFSEGFSDTYLTSNVNSATPTWTYKGIERDAQHVPWLAWTESEWFTLGEIEFDPIVQDRIWITYGTGTFYVDLDNSPSLLWNEFSKGQEHLVSNDVVSFSNGNKLTAHWDFPIFMHTSSNAYPSQHLPTQRFNSCWDLSQSPTDENFVVALIEDIRYCCYDENTRSSGYSEDGGLTWTQFPTMPEGEFDLIFGQLEVSAGNNNNIVWLPGFEKNPYYSLDKGSTWTEVILPGASDACCLGGPWFRRKALIADQVASGKFHIYDWGSGDLFTTVNGGAEWVKKAGVLPAWSFNAKLLTVPGHTDHLFFSNGPEEAEDLIEGLMRSTDGGNLWTEVPSTSKVINVTIGKEAPGASYPTIYICGEVNGVYGYYRSIDNCETWTSLGQFPLGIYDVPVAFEANPHEFGNVTIGYGGNGFVQYQESTVLPINLLSFEVTKDGADAELTWVVASGSNAEKFEVESSVDGINYDKIGDVEANENSTINQVYDFLDLDIIASYEGETFVYYRLKMYDTDGSFEYSVVRTLGITQTINLGKMDVRLYPNPSSFLFTIEGQNTDKTITEVRVYDQLGQLILLKSPNTDRHTVDVSALRSGSYTVEIWFGNHSLHKQFVKI